MKKNIRKVRGQGTLEWILILFVLVGFVMIFGKTLKGKIGGLVDKVFTTVESNVSGLSGSGS
jgi:hypothetical protein